MENGLGFRVVEVYAAFLQCAVDQQSCPFAFLFGRADFFRQDPQTLLSFLMADGQVRVRIDSGLGQGECGNAVFFKQQPFGVGRSVHPASDEWLSDLSGNVDEYVRHFNRFIRCFGRKNGEDAVNVIVLGDGSDRCAVVFGRGIATDIDRIAARTVR